MDHKTLEEYNSKRRITQICFVTDNYQSTIKDLYERLLLGPWTIISHQNDVTNVKFNGIEINEPFKFFCAFTFVGDIQIEVIQPVYGDNPYSQFLRKNGVGIHHIKEQVADDELLKRIDELKRRGNRISYEGKYQEDVFYYLDMNDIFNGYYEIGNGAEIAKHSTLIGYFPEI